ncbi:hypothetical protein [Massilia cavernae]|uniref:Uncharacterized protein n=1 Tax=Massilia cavernae TaxID=2320864 RepID=A0A418Y4I3_9BURK|nr:hypothetical protein [Massilia cavernae]RJG20479.1 hypothetical protein D3872_08425 [Massilia cavernae]
MCSAPYRSVSVSRVKHDLETSDARADRKTIEARNDARDNKRDAEYKVALEKCDAFAGAAKDNCVAAARTQYGK